MQKIVRTINYKPDFSMFTRVMTTDLRICPRNFSFFSPTTF